MQSLINFHLAALFLTFCALRSEAAVTASSLAIVGYDDYRDSFSVMALDNLAAGEVIYFTNNGWSSSQGRFNGADDAQGAGNESLIKLTLNQTIAKGSVIVSNANDGAWTWTKSGLVPGQIDGEAVFSDLALDFESDQIYAFQGSLDNPLLNPTNFLYALHFGSPDYPGFSDSEDSLTGDIPPGLSLLDKTAFAHTNLSFHGDADGHHSSWGLDMNSPEVQQLLTSGGTNTQWLNAIANSDNWGAVAPPPDESFLDAAPEPTKAMLLLLGLCAVGSKRRRKA